MTVSASKRQAVEVTEKWIPDQLICRSSGGGYSCPEYMSVSPHVFSIRQDSSLTSEEVSSLIGASRTTVRRYLEYLVSQTILDVDVNYGGVGRPERRYFLRRHL
ncbi:MAG: DeoR family transcriptional regulator [SAR324 cluster bacterium]